MAMVCAQSLAVVRIPAADVLILCGREDEITVSIVPTLSLGKVTRKASYGVGNIALDLG